VSVIDVDISGFELHNMVRTPPPAPGEPPGLRVRKPFVSLNTPTAGTVYVGSKSIENPSTTEVLHYLFEQATATGIVTLRVMTENFVELFNFPLGQMQADPIITGDVVDNQIMFNSPSFSTPLFGYTGGGIISAVAQASIQPNTTAIEIPNGHICGFGDRFVIAQYTDFFVSDPNDAFRSYVGENAVGIGGTIFDIFQGPDGALFLSTSAGAFSLSADALGQGQEVQGSISRIPGIDTSRSRNAIAAAGVVVVLQRDHVQILGGPAINLAPYTGRRLFSRPIDVEDLRLSGELFATSNGFVVGFRGKRGHFIVYNLKDNTMHYVWSASASTSFNLVGTLRDRDGNTQYVLRDRVAAFIGSGATDYDGVDVNGVACGRLPANIGDNAMVRRVTVGATNVGNLTGVYVSGVSAATNKTAAAPTKSRDIVIGTSLWAVAGQAMGGRALRSVRHSVAVRSVDPNLEIIVSGANRRVHPIVSVEVGGQGRTVDDKG
jgi:hypothetical protein